MSDRAPYFRAVLVPLFEYMANLAEMGWNWSDIELVANQYTPGQEKD